MDVNGWDNSASLAITKGFVFFKVKVPLISCWIKYRWTGSYSSYLSNRPKTNMRWSESTFKMIHQSAPTQTPRYSVGVPYVFQNRPISSWQGFNKVLETFQREVSPCLLKSITQLLQICQQDIYDRTAWKKLILLHEVLCLHIINAAGLKPLEQSWNDVWYAIIFTKYACDKW